MPPKVIGGAVAVLPADVDGRRVAYAHQPRTLHL